MKRFTGEDGREWVATALEEDTPRHHGRWYMVVHPADDEGPQMTLPEIRWQSRHSAERTLQGMSEFELRRRLRIAAGRHEGPGMARTPFGEYKAGEPGTRGGAASG